MAENGKKKPVSPHKLRDAAVIGFGLTLAVLVVGGVLGYTNARRLDDNSRWVAHTHEVIGALETLLSTLKDAETGQRGYLLAEEEKYLEPYDDALKRVQSKVSHLKQLTFDNPDQQARLAVLNKKIDVRMDELAQTVALMKKGDRPAALMIVRSGTGKAHMDELRQEIAIMQQAEHDLLRKRADESATSYRTTVLSILLPAIIGFVLVGVVFYLSQRNIRQRQRAAEVLAEQKERLRTTLASIGDAVISTDEGGNITYMNVVAEALTGWKNEESSGAPLTQVFNIVNESTRQPVENPALRALKEGVVVGLANHMVLISKDGTERPIDDSASPIRCRDGEIVGCVLVFRDVTERQGQEKALREQEQQFRTLAESIPQLCWMANQNGHIFWYNRRWYDYTGTTFEEMAGWGWQSVHDPDELPKVLERWKASIAASEPFDMVFPLKGKDGVFRPFLTRIEPVKNAEGRVARWFGTNTDITEAKRTEEELRRLTAELSEADRRKDEFLATLAHELRNPLAPIRNGLQIMRLSGGSGAEVDQARTMMERQLGQMVHLVDDLLDVSRISRGKLALRKERVKISTVINNAVETSRTVIEANGHELTVSIPPDATSVDADVTRLAQVFANLLNNSAKYSERGSRIRLTVERQGNDVVVSVRDSGVGIPSDMLPKIFDIFTQVDRSLERSQGGLGIGLTLVKRLVEMHGGSVKARSEGNGRGSEFVVRLPVVLSAVQEDKPTEEAEPACRSGQCRILVADDNEDSATSLAMMLKIMGNEVRTANNGLQAVELATAFQPNVILLDIGMPKLNGYEACRRIRDQPWAEKVVLIAVTGWGQSEDRRRSEEAGFNHHMVKPVDAAALEMLLAGAQKLQN
jgi:PAS domain S-box-containing protein